MYLPHVDFVLLMTIPRIGVQGIPYEPSAPARVAKFHAKYPNVPISVDGGVSEALFRKRRILPPHSCGSRLSLKALPYSSIFL
jgi:pentose-5-phosphate-3-epimerase